MGRWLFRGHTRVDSAHDGNERSSSGRTIEKVGEFQLQRLEEVVVEMRTKSVAVGKLFPDENVVLVVGIRGYGTGGATWAWGVNAAEYERRADVWPLNPDGDLFAIVMIESVEGLKNLDAIATVPGVGALFLGAGSDLSRSLGVRPNTPEVEAAFQQVLSGCKSHKVACGITAGSGTDVARRVKEGWNIIRSTVPAITQGRQLLGQQ